MFKSIIALLSLVSPAFAGVITSTFTTSTSCALPGQSYSGPLDCMLTSGSVTVHAMNTQDSQFSITATVAAFSSQGSAVIDESFWVNTDGPLRPGYLIISEGFGGAGIDEIGRYGLGQMSASAPGFSASGIADDALNVLSSCAGTKGVNCIVPVTLGNSYMPFHLHAEATATNTSFVFARSQVYVAFTEMDLQTPVGFSAAVVPEPSTWIMIIVAAAMIALTRFSEATMATHWKQ